MTCPHCTNGKRVDMPCTCPRGQAVAAGLAEMAKGPLVRIHVETNSLTLPGPHQGQNEKGERNQ